MRTNNLKDKKGSENKQKEKEHVTLLRKNVVLQTKEQVIPIKLSEILPDQTKEIIDLLNRGIVYLASKSEIEQDIEYYKAINSLMFARDTYKTLINSNFYIKLKMGYEEEA